MPDVVSDFADARENLSRLSTFIEETFAAPSIEKITIDLPSSRFRQAAPTFHSFIALTV